MVEVAERRADGTRIAKVIGADGAVKDEYEALIFVSQLGSAQRGTVSLSISGAAPEHFDVYMAACIGMVTCW